ncbi:G-protein coupled receptor 4-like [Megalops cyprinoides]|uniref:G-protein coupled receptor 4-like n=1 Tax=Megalops cyprinoides TaxID=118141 RepID=UPI001863EA8B|nr:G-protein coupled receptor 4-like [Megalops cyprinoides]
MDDRNSTHYGRNSTWPVNSGVIVFGWITLCIEFPVICWAIFALYHLVKNDRVAPVYVINLLISDIIQLIGRLGFLIDFKKQPMCEIFAAVSAFGILASVVFMVCIALERYLVIVHPLWYRYRRTVRHSVLMSLIAWVSPFILYLLAAISIHYSGHKDKAYLPLLIFFILPFPLLVFFLVATWRALSRSTSVPVTERKRILWILFLVLGNYALLFFPVIIYDLIVLIHEGHEFNVNLLIKIGITLLFMSPLMDPLLYIFMRKDANDTLKVLPCCQRLIGRQEPRQVARAESENLTSV